MSEPDPVIALAEILQECMDMIGFDHDGDPKEFPAALRDRLFLGSYNVDTTHNFEVPEIQELSPEPITDAP